MICRKCGHMWFIEKIPLPKEIECPNCGELISLTIQPGPPEPPLSPDVITDIIIDNCFHLIKGRGLPILYSYSEKTLRHLKRVGYEVSRMEDHVLYMRNPQ